MFMVSVAVLAAVWSSLEVSLSQQKSRHSQAINPQDPSDIETGKVEEWEAVTTVWRPQNSTAREDGMQPTAQTPRWNVLIIMADDFRPEISGMSDSRLGYNKHIYTPHLSQLARRSAVFSHAYSQYPLCDPSRTSLLTSRRPDSTRIYRSADYHILERTNYTTLPQYFRQHGYVSVPIGKVIHPGGSTRFFSDRSWSWRGFHHDPVAKRHWRIREATITAVPERERSKHPLEDDAVADQAIKNLRQLANQKAPFLLAVGFKKPHFPLTFPAKFLEHYPLSAVPMPTRKYPPIHSPSLAQKNRTSLTKYSDVSDYRKKAKEYSTFPDEKVRDIRRAYFATVTFIDSLIGRILAEVQSLGLEQQTIIAVTSDHGYHLGENGIWGKVTTYELATHVPLLLKLPGITDRGVVVDQPVELVDLFPTLVEAAGLPALVSCSDSTERPVCTEGASLLPLIQDPIWSGDSRMAFSQLQYRNSRLMAYTVRTEQYRYTAWTPFAPEEEARASWDHIEAEELYDYDRDPSETVNIVHQPEYEDVKTRLRDVLSSRGG